jgi:hypothetical protein
MPEPTNDPFRSLRDVARPVDPDREFVDAVMRAVEDRLEGSPTASSSSVTARRTDLPVVPAGTPSGSADRSSRWWIAAALVPIVAGSLIAVSEVRERRNEDAGASLPAVADPTVVPPINWNELQLEGQGDLPFLESGTYVIDPDGDPATPLTVTYDVPEGWRQWFGALKFYGEAESADGARDGQVILSITTVSNLVADGCGGDRPADPEIGPTVDDLATGLAALSPFELSVPPTDVSAFGYEGTYLQLTVPDLSPDEHAECDLRSWFAPLNGGEPFHFYDAESGRVEEFWILDVEGTRLVLAANWAPGSPEGTVAEMRAMFDSIRIQPCGPTGPTEKGTDMNKWAIPTTAVAAVMLLGACGDDGPTTIAKGDAVQLTGDQDLAGQTLDIDVEEEDGEVTGEIRFTDSQGGAVVRVECADTETDGVVIVGGTLTESTGDDMTGLLALFIKEGDPDRVSVWLDQGENKSCSDLLTNRRDVLDDETLFVDVEDGSDIETG